MIKRFIKPKNKKAIFICQFTENFLKVIKCQLSHGSKREFVDLGLEEIPPDLDSKKLSERLSRIFKKLEYNNNPVIVSLPRQYVTCRYIKVPTQLPAEIEKIVALQASTYLPYPANELITGYQLIFTDREGYSDINLFIAHKSAVERYTDIFNALNIKDVSVVLSSIGLLNLYRSLEPPQEKPIIIVDIDLSQVEVAVVFAEKLLFSRSFRINRQQENWQSLLIEEITKTKDAYLKETKYKEPAKIVVVGSRENSQEFVEIIRNQINLPIMLLSHWDKITGSEIFLDSILKVDNSLASLVGLGLSKIPEYINLLPQTKKEEAKKFVQAKEQLKSFLIVAGIIIMFALGITKNLNNKEIYLRQLKMELNKIEEDAKPIAELKKRLDFLDTRLQEKPSCLEVLHELYRVIPEQVFLTNFTYEERNQIILRGQSPELKYVWGFVSQLEKSAIFKSFNAKVRYATKKKMQTGEVVDFEIVCLKK